MIRTEWHDGDNYTIYEVKLEPAEGLNPFSDDGLTYHEIRLPDGRVSRKRFAYPQNAMAYITKLNEKLAELAEKRARRQQLNKMRSAPNFGAFG